MSDRTMVPDNVRIVRQLMKRGGDAHTVEVLAEGTEALERPLQLREALAVRDHAAEPATPDFGPVRVVAVHKTDPRRTAAGCPGLLVAVSKPPGIPTHPGGAFFWASLIGMLARGEFIAPDESETLRHVSAMTALHLRGCSAGACSMPCCDCQWRPLHRLDRGTGGILLLGTTGAAASVGTPLLRTVEHALQPSQALELARAVLQAPAACATRVKRYAFVAKGHIPAEFEEGVHLLQPRYFVVTASLPETSTVGAASRSDRHFSAATLFHVADVSDSAGFVSGIAWLLHGGRQHQIRRHLSLLGLAIVGDTMYGDPRPLASVTQQRVMVRRDVLDAYPGAFAVDEAGPDPASGEGCADERDEGGNALLMLHSCETSLNIGGATFTARDEPWWKRTD